MDFWMALKQVEFILPKESYLIQKAIVNYFLYLKQNKEIKYYEYIEAEKLLIMWNYLEQIYIDGWIFSGDDIKDEVSYNGFVEQTGFCI
jgi:hypothetical protein